MPDVALLPVAHMRRIAPFFPVSRGLRRVDRRRVISGTVYVIRHGLQWKDAPRGYGPHKTLYNRFVRWSRLGVFDRIFAALVAAAGVPDRLITRPRPAWPKGAAPRCIGRTKGGLNSKLHTVCDGQGRPVRLLLTAGQTSDHAGAAILLADLPSAASPPESQRHAAERGRCHTTGPSTGSGIASRTPSVASRTGAVSQPATIAAHTPSSQPSASTSPSRSG